MKNKDLIMFGIIVGVAFFFLGAMITSSFPGNEENLLPYKISSFVKLIGLGILTTTFLIGGITGHDLNKYFRLSILIIGLVLLLIFTIELFLPFFTFSPFTTPVLIPIID